MMIKKFIWWSVYVRTSSFQKLEAKHLLPIKKAVGPLNSIARCNTPRPVCYRLVDETEGEQLWAYLTRRHKKRRAFRSRPSRDTVKDRVSIHDRPETVDQQAELGHWEGDLIICQRTRPVLVLHERKTRVTLAARLAGKGAAETASVIMSIFRRLDPGLRQSITFDNDTCFARHTWLHEAFEMATYFCDAYASWQKGGIENANGRLRRWLPRQTNLDDLSDEDLQEIVMTYNLSPRKCLGYRTPLQALFSELGRDVRLRFA